MPSDWIVIRRNAIHAMRFCRQKAATLARSNAIWQCYINWTLTSQVPPHRVSSTSWSQVKRWPKHDQLRSTAVLRQLLHLMAERSAPLKERDGFRDLIKCLEPQYVIKSRTTATNSAYKEHIMLIFERVPKSGRVPGPLFEKNWQLYSAALLFVSDSILHCHLFFLFLFLFISWALNVRYVLIFRVHRLYCLAWHVDWLFVDKQCGYQSYSSVEKFTPTNAVNEVTSRESFKSTNDGTPERWPQL